MRISNIVVATDLSDLSGIAARWAQACGILFNCPITVAHVIELNLPNWARGAYDILENEEMLQKTKGDLIEWFKKYANTAPDAVFIGVGDSVKQLSEAVEEYDSPLLILSTSGKHSVRKVFIGSTAQAIASEVPCATLLASPSHPLIGRGTTIGIATDLTVISDRAVIFAAELARGLNSTLEIIHASSASSSVAIDVNGDISDQALSDQAKEGFKAFFERHAEVLKDIPHRNHIIANDPVSAISGFVEESELDILIIGFMGEVSKIENLFGRFAVRILNRIGSSMIIIPGDLPED